MLTHYIEVGGPGGPRGPWPPLFDTVTVNSTIKSLLTVTPERSYAIATVHAYACVHLSCDYYTCGFSVYDLILNCYKSHCKPTCSSRWNTKLGLPTLWKVPMPMSSSHCTDQHVPWAQVGLGNASFSKCASSPDI